MTRHSDHIIYSKRLSQLWNFAFRTKINYTASPWGDTRLKIIRRQQIIDRFMPISSSCLKTPYGLVLLTMFNKRYLALQLRQYTTTLFIWHSGSTTTIQLKNQLIKCQGYLTTLPLLFSPVIYTDRPDEFACPRKQAAQSGTPGYNRNHYNGCRVCRHAFGIEPSTSSLFSLASPSLSSCSSPPKEISASGESPLILLESGGME